MVSDKEWFGIVGSLGVAASWLVALSNPVLGVSIAAVVLSAMLVAGTVDLSKYIDGVTTSSMLSSSQIKRVASWSIVYIVSLTAIIFNEVFLVAALGVTLYAILPFTQSGNMPDEVIRMRAGLRLFVAAIMFILYTVPSLFLLVALMLALILMLNIMPEKDRSEIYDSMDLRVME